MARCTKIGVRIQISIGSLKWYRKVGVGEIIKWGKWYRNDASREDFNVRKEVRVPIKKDLKSGIGREQSTRIGCVYA